MKMLCLCCPKEAKYSILLFRGEQGDGSAYSRWYIPNQSRNEVPELLEEVWFCPSCMRKIEDDFRQSILTLQTESGKVAP